MLIRQVDCVVKYIAGLNDSLKTLTSTVLSKSQCKWLATVLMGIIVAGSFNWAAFSRHSLGAFSEERLRWMFCYANIAWHLLLRASVAHLISHYEITAGVLA